jgi:multidrug efflux pump subunit AcrA (membrane-fusion protein)
MTSISSTNSEKKLPAHSRNLKLPKRVLWTGLVLLVVIIGAGIFYLVRAQQTKTAAAAQQPALQTSVARQGNLILRASGTGTLIAASEVNLGFKTSGILTALNVKLGDQVKAGDLLAQLDDSNQQVQLAQAQQALNELTSPSAIATAQLAVTTAQANVINAQAALKDRKSVV